MGPPSGHFLSSFPPEGKWLFDCKTDRRGAENAIFHNLRYIVKGIFYWPYQNFQLPILSWRPLEIRSQTG
jgi:hypothetical protein